MRPRKTLEQSLDDSKDIPSHLQSSNLEILSQSRRDTHKRQIQQDAEPPTLAKSNEGDENIWFVAEEANKKQLGASKEDKVERDFYLKMAISRLQANGSLLNEGRQ